MGRPRDPQTPEEWQEAVNAAEFLLLIDSARQYGLIEGGPKVNGRRADAILDRGRRLGYLPLSTDGLMNLFWTNRGIADERRKEA